MIITMNTTDYSEMKASELAKLIREECVPGINDSFESILVHLRSAHVVEPKEEEVNYILQHIERIYREFKTHADKEDIHLLPVKHLLYTDDHHKDAAAKKILDDCTREHAHFRNEIRNIHKLSESFHCEVSASPSHKLAYAELGVLEQDMQRLFFIEEQYLFPKLRKTFRTTN